LLHVAPQSRLPAESIASALCNERRGARRRPGEQCDYLTLTPPAAGFAPGISTCNDSQLKAGFTAGGGLERRLFKDWSLKAEALYYGLGRSSLNQTVQQTFPGGGVLITNTGPQTTWRNNGVIARAALNYHLYWFDAAPVVTRY
jgi:hypothetical protein